MLHPLAPSKGGMHLFACSSRFSQIQAPTCGHMLLPQDALTEELAGMAASLKSSTLAVEGKLRERGQLLDATETALDHSVQHTKRSAAEASRIHKT